MMTDKIWRARPRKAAGPDRPRYFDEGDVDRVMAILLALASEVASIRERLDTHERVAAQGALPTPELVEGFIPDAAAETDRDLWRDAYIHRLFRVITEDIEKLKADSDAPDGSDLT
jgi:hypothetical protein